MMTVLVANRGEIARRVFRTAQRMGLRTVAVHSDADAGAPFVREADAAVRIGPAAARDSYLNIPSIIGAARETGSQLIHPGYGFLSEQAAFAEAVAAAGMTFVGPSPDVLRRLGDKGQAKAAAERAGVPVVPGYRGADQQDGAFAAAARTVGYPVMLKPAAGGGGIGMQLVAREADLSEALARARRTATAAFGDERLILERAIDRPRHVEIQLLADTHGAVVALGERDCSAQRRHQKVLEETPSPAVDAALRQRMSDAAVALAKAVGYVNAGTCEFIVDVNGDFFFLEVNARLQVEHPVTELVWGVDLVEQQLRIAMGERLSVPAQPRGHAVEVRLYAEDPASGFLPSTGRIALVEWPDGVRVDAGIEEGSVVTADYDPMLAKVIVQAVDRASALDALDAALRASTVLGVRTNERFLRGLIAHPEMRAGRADTGLIERSPELAAGPGDPPPDARALAAAAFAASNAPTTDVRDPWRSLAGWRAGGPPRMNVVLDDTSIVVSGAGPFTIDGRTIERDERAGHWLIGAERGIAVRDGTELWVKWRGETYVFDSAGRERSIDAQAGSEITAPMPGTVLAVHASAGQQVTRGDLICVVEAMKMELRVEAPADGTIRSVLCAQGDQVRRGQRLAEFEPA
ncbi:MAG: ATP-grasp domain-containing protein [Chloroflexota bacterium]|nr:ATP-grasp domain-containing protein [Chloroflexota bacterium]